MIRPRATSLQVIVYAGIDPATGKQRYLRESTRAGQKAAERIERRLQAKVDAGHTHDERATVAELLDKWFELAEPDLSPTTAEGYRRIIEKTLRPRFGKLLLTKLTGEQLDALYLSLARRKPKPLGASAIKQVHAVIHVACVQAVKWGWLTVNPADAATPPRVRRKELDLPVPDEIRSLIAWAETEDADLAVLIRLAAATGARRGELLALRWSDVDLDTGQVMILRARVAVAGSVVEKNTKAENNRPLALDDRTIAVLRAHRVREAEKALKCGVPLDNDAPLLTGLPGHGWYPDTATARFAHARAEAGVSDRVKLKNVRHWHVSGLLESGEQVLNVSRRVGHTSSKMTLDVYGHKIRARDQSAARAIAALLDGSAEHG